MHQICYDVQGGVSGPWRQIEPVTEGPADRHDMAVTRSLNEPVTVKRY